MEKIKTHFQVKIPTTYSIVFRLPKGVQLTILALCIWHMQFMKRLLPSTYYARRPAIKYCHSFKVDTEIEREKMVSNVDRVCNR